MASFTKRGTSSRAGIAPRGLRLAATFDTEAESVALATTKELEILAGTPRMGGGETVADAARCYAASVSTGKRSARWQHLQIEAFIGDSPTLAYYRLSEVSALDFAARWDARLGVVCTGTVLREINLLSNVSSIGRDEWKWIAERPMTGIRRPTQAQSRDRHISTDEDQCILFALGYDSERAPTTVPSRIVAAFPFAIETATRAGKITGVTLDRMHVDRRCARLDLTKNSRGRDVPLSSKAMAIVHQMESDARQSNLVFNLTTAQLDSLFRKARNSLGIAPLHFHDTQHGARTRLARKGEVWSWHEWSASGGLRFG